MKTVKTDIENHVAYLRLNRPEAFNSFNRDMALGLQSALDFCEKDERIRAIVITGEGKAFCAGQDLKEATDEKLNPGFRVLLEEHYAPIIKRIRNIEKPIIAAVNGVAAGAGANIALACDIVVASSQAKFIQAFSKIGLIPDSGGTFFLPRLIGIQRATALIMTGDAVDAKEAERIGMIYRVYESDVFEEEVDKLAVKLSNAPTKALALSKKALNASVQNSLNQQLELETELQLEASQTADYNEGVTAFKSKRKPNFIGA